MTSSEKAPPGTIRSALAILRKDWSSEIRTRYAISALIMFVLTAVSIILFSLGNEEAPPEVLCAMLWVVIFFSAMSGLSRTFVAEEERGTAMTLQLLASPASVYCGKLLFNLVLVHGLNAVTVVLYMLFVHGFVVQTYSIFLVTLLLGSLGFAAAATIIAAIIAKANTKGTLYPVLSFPILLPLLLTVINATKLAVEGAFFDEAIGEFQLLLSYIVAIVIVSFLLFEYIWKD
ncbi:MAG: heme exporter protein CcmB [Bacteroidota bacterium]